MENEYYPYGLQSNTSWTRDNSKNNFLYNEGSEINTTTGWYDLPYRNYDAALGRFMQIDPLATQYASLSPYHYSGNNPVMHNDPSGADYNDYPHWYSPGGDPRAPGVTEPYTGPSDPGAARAYDNFQDLWVANGGDRPYYEYLAMANGGYDVGQNKNGEWGYWMDTPLDNEAGIATKFVKTQTQRGANVILNFSNESYALRPGSGWLYRSVCDMDEANTYLQSLTSAGKAIRNLVVVGHANIEHISLGENGYIASDLEPNGNMTTPETLAKFNKMIANVSSGGNLLIIGCNADTRLGPALQSNVRCDINIFMNSGLCRLERYPSDTGIYFNSNVIVGGQYRNITQDPNGTSPYRYISLNANGTLNVTK